MSGRLPRPECATCGVGMLAAQGEGCCLDVYEAINGPVTVRDFGDDVRLDEDGFFVEEVPWPST